MAKRIYTETVKKWAIGSGIVGTSISILLIFTYLSSLGLIDITGYSKDSYCTATSWNDDPNTFCYAYIDFTVGTEDIFIYPTDYDPWGRNIPFEFYPGVKDFKFQRSWGEGWRNIPLDRGCTGTWCGGKPKIKENTFSIAFREGRSYKIRVVAIKNSPFDTIKWSFGNDISKNPADPVWFGINITKLCEWKTIQEDVFDYVTRERKVFGNCIYYLNNTICDDEPLNTSCYTNTTEKEVSCITGKESYQSYEKIGAKDIEVCDKVVSYKINDKIINLSKGNLGVNIEGTKFCTWKCLDGDCNTELPFDYVKSRIEDVGGWSGKCFDLKNENWYDIKLNLHSKKFGREDFIEEIEIK